MEKKYTIKDVIAIKRIALLERKNRDIKGKHLNRYDYYMLGGINLKNAYNIIYNMYENRDITSSELETIRTYLIFQASMRVTKGLNNLVKIYFQFGDYVINKDEKELVYKGLIAKGIAPECIDELVFSAAVREYAKGIGVVKEKNNSKSK